MRYGAGTGAFKRTGPAPSCDCSGKANMTRDESKSDGSGDAAKRDLRLRGDPDRLAGLVFLDRLRRPAGARRACDVDRADPANPVHVSGRRSLQIPAARRQPRHRRDLCRHLRLRFHSFLPRVRRDRDLAAGLLHDAGLHRRPADVPAGDGAVAARASGAVLDQRRSRPLHAVGLSQPDRFLLASRHDVLPRGHVERRSSSRPASTASTASSRSP